MATRGLHRARAEPSQQPTYRLLGVTSIHPTARVFGRVVARYERGRPGYPKAAVDYGLEQGHVASSDCVLEVGAGTGKLTRLLLGRVGHVTAVEPVAGMRDVLVASLPDVKVLDGTAENVPVGDAEFRAVFAAQAFHWFDHRAALQEFHRLLASPGCLVLMWNVRDETSPVNAAVSKIIDPFYGDAPHHSELDWKRIIVEGGWFHNVASRDFHFRQRLDHGAFTDRFMSVSWVASLPEAIRESVRRRLEHVHANLEVEGTVTVPYVTRVYVAARSQV